MPEFRDLFDKNREWSRGILEKDPSFFKTLSMQQSPKFLWIGCSDSRVPANDIVGLLPGELFVHRNVSNVVVHTDLNCLSVIQYAVDVLQVQHIIVCGHYGCGGVTAALNNTRLGLIDNWLRHVQDVKEKYFTELSALPKEAQVARLCELNAMEQVINVGQTTAVQVAWERGQKLHVHGIVYGLTDGLIKDLGITLTGPQSIPLAQRPAGR
jgi:carbonic anhydrase